MTNSDLNKSASSIKRVMIAGTHSGVGKTTVTLGISAMLKKRGYRVQGFKSGPDYIDIGHHSEVTGNQSRNLDTWMMDNEVCKELFYRSAIKADISIIEGVMGLYDGRLGEKLKGSSAYLADVLNTPVILVMDVKGMAQSAGAVALGFKQYDSKTRICGIILNRIGSQRHFDFIKSAIETVVNIPVIGYLARNQDYGIGERHLGLIPSAENKNSSEFYNKLGELMESTVDVNKIIGIAGAVGEFPHFNKSVFCIDKNVKQGSVKKCSVKIGVALDEAFHFYYQDNLDLLESSGAELIYFSPLKDAELPGGINGLYIGGGFPEFFGPELEANENMRLAIYKAAMDGVVIYAECGGMMYLLDKLVNCDGNSFKMCGVFSAISRMEKKRQGLGYIMVNAQEDTIICKKGEVFKAHEFHWSSIITNNNDLSFAYSVSKGDNNKIKFDGFFSENVLASYVHIHFGSNPMLAENLLSSMCLSYK